LRKLAIALLLCLAAAAPALATCPSAGPAELLYAPYFAVDLAGGFEGETTLFAVGNASDTAVLARVDLFNVNGQWGGGYHVSIDPGATHTVNLRDVFSGDRLICPPHFATLNSTALRSILEGEDGVARGYATVRMVTACSLLPPELDLQVHENALLGDRFSVEPGQNFADGGLLVSRLVPGRHRVRYMANGGAFDSTSLEILMPDVGGEATWIPVDAFDETGAPVSLSVNFVGGLRGVAANRFDVDQHLGPGSQFGSLVIDCGEHPCAVRATYKADGRFSAGAEGVPLDCED
jgi:hypothetical protein